VEVLQTNMDHLRDLGILPPQQVSVSVNNGTTTTSATTGTSTNTPTNGLTFNNLKHLNSGNYSITTPTATATAILADTETKIIQNPEIRSVDGQIAHLKIGQRIPVATGSFQAGVGVGATGGAGLDRKSTRLNSSHVSISYAVFCLKKKTRPIQVIMRAEE